MTTLLPSGDQLSISGGGFTATVCEVGATLRSLQLNGRDLVAPFAEDGLPEGCQGQQLMPWPNRIRDGRYHWRGESQQLAISEVPRNTALHGLVSWVAWQTVDHTASSLTQRVVVYPQPGWPGIVECVVTHSVDEDGLTVTVGATNLGQADIPFGYAAHPYLRTGETRIDDVAITLPADRYLVVDPERLLPISLADVDETWYDLRHGHRLEATQLDTAFTGLSSGEDDLWRVSLRHGEDETVLWAESLFGWIQVYTSGDRTMLAVEPMTCGPDAFNEGPTHDDVIVLAPGAGFSGRWGITGR